MHDVRDVNLQCMIVGSQRKFIVLLIHVVHYHKNCADDFIPKSENIDPTKWKCPKHFTPFQDPQTPSTLLTRISQDTEPNFFPPVPKPKGLLPKILICLEFYLF